MPRRTHPRAKVVEAYRRLRNQHAVARELGLAQSNVSRNLARARELGELEADVPAKSGIKGHSTATRRTGRAKVVEAYQRLGRQSLVAHELGLAESTVSAHLARARELGELPPVFEGRVSAQHARDLPLPKNGNTRTYVITAAQNNTPVHQPLWDNLMALAEHDGAQVMVAQFSYNRSAYGAGDVKPGTEPDEDDTGIWYDPQVLPHVCNERLRLAPDLVFCGELNVLPTAVHPLSGLETYTGTDSFVVPHAKIALKSLPRAKGEHAKIGYTTGACTLRNYIGKTAGQKGEFHHAFAALHIEVDADGDWFASQLNAADDGTIYHLKRRVRGGEVEYGDWVRSIVWGDVHEETLEDEIRAACWTGPGNIKDELHPGVEVFHDLNDFRRRNHHDRGQPFKNYAKWRAGQESIEEEVARCARFLEEAWRPWCTSVVVASNHDMAMERWMREADWRTDPVNARFLLEANLRALEAIDEGRDFYAPEWAIRRAGCPEGVRFLKIDEQLVVLGVNLGDHGHNGPNGTRGSVGNLVRVGRKATIGHGHSPEIRHGLHMVGVMGNLQQGYNDGPSSWAHAFSVQYENGKRSMQVMRGAKWRTQRPSAVAGAKKNMCRETS